ncbi:Gfo/Idh/MocA family oxidoreductase [Micromonospora sp. WMMD712]|uniref:Gfo/Idh/MocA family oxidoreductase n=1 Tax=Micromonospora sp. WMMD712 TaxID=3016096 RepID=UPI00249A33BE|nr:Gfo/Idh/MocA family oxidoreductase [Micromonospora sp. WMMD712]WFE60206.1 Gfo/Idh/MocA family oxidoreductase [Micromonospora sp. WMMD712]
MKIGVIGVGRIGSVHARNLASMLPANSLLIHDADATTAHQVAAELAGSVRPTVAALVEDADAVVVATPATERSDILATAMAKGTAVFCEKPLAAELEEARQVARTARRTGARFQVGFQRRFDPDYRRLHQLVASGAAGQLIMIRGTAFDHRPPDEGYQLTSGDIFTDCLIHDIDAARWIAHDEVVAVQADAREVPDQPARDDGIGVGTVVLTFAGGGVAVLTASRLNPLGYDHRMEVLGTRLSMAAGLNGMTPLRVLQATRLPGTRMNTAARSGEMPAFADFTERFAAAYRAEMRAFLDLAAGGGPSPCGPDDALRAQEIAAAAATAGRTGARTPVPFSRDEALTS